MGITGLIPFLEKASEKVHLKDIRGSTVAIDTYCWLHKGVFSCAEKLVRGEDSDLYVQYCLKYVQMLLTYDIKPILVFDGQHLPAKELTEKRRRESRQESKKRAAELLRLGRVEEARSQMRRCVDVTHEMALRLIKECRSRNVDCIVAPYEADAQMAWLNKAGIANYIITEDSDLTLFGAQKIIFKLDLTGGGLLVDGQKLHLAMGCREEKYNFDKFRRMCILSGCDYLDSLPGIGLAKACKFILKTEQDDMRIALKKIPQYLNMRNLQVDDDYIDNFLMAEATFKHMFIYNPLERRMERLNSLTEYSTDERYCSNAGTLLTDSEQALHLALGNLNPFTLKHLDNWHPDDTSMGGLLQAPTKNVKRAKHKSIWQTNFTTHNDDKSTTTTKETNCALFFKKVDFISQSIDDEIAANQRMEQSKHTEAEVFGMYSFGVKRKRKRSTSSECGDVSPPPSPSPSPKSSSAKSRHNPFAKEQQSPKVCENGSLLRLLSPSKKSTAEAAARDEARMNSLKRSIFAREHVEVRSRFFGSPQTSAESPQPPPPLVEAAATIEESTSETKLEPPSPPMAVAAAQEIVLILSDESMEETTPTSSQETISSMSSSSLSPGLSSTSNAQTPKLQDFQRRPIGLTKPKHRTKPTTARKVNLKGDQNQPKLSMFGFKQRPVLK